MEKKNRLSEVTHAAIHPSIGVARVGNSLEWFLGPETPNIEERTKGFYRDDAGAIKRQAARFRIFGYNKDGEVVAELNAENVELSWEVHIANKKGAWYIMNYAMDIPQALPVPLRNSNILSEKRNGLKIDPGPRKIHGINNKGKTEYIFDTGEFMGESVYLGELQTDSSGRLIFLGGFGIAKSIHPGNFITGVGNQDGWYDDICDGPVKAKVKIDGRDINVKEAWVISVPVNFAPDFKSLVSMWDCIYDTMIQGSILNFPDKISFKGDIYPIFERLASYGWLNEGYLHAFGHRGPYNFFDDGYISRLARNGAEHREFRRQVYRRFRNPEEEYPTWDKWPWNYGDGIDAPPAKYPNQYFSLTKTQSQILQKWMEGEFLEDWNKEKPIHEIEKFSIEEQPSTLDRASLDFLVGGPFRPGIELTWPMRHATMYSEPFRIRIRTENNPEKDYGETLNSQVATSIGGPLYYNSAGDLTRWMSVPWQLDVAGCRFAYFGSDPFLPTFWPVRVPNQVLTEEDYIIVMDEKNYSREQRLKAFYSRKGWYRFISGGTFTQMNMMISKFILQGFIERRPGIQNDEDFPSVMYVEESPLHENSPARGETDFDYLKLLESYNSYRLD